MATSGCDAPRPAPTPLSGFSAPFVFGRFQLPADNPLTEPSVALGRRLFYDRRLSGNDTVSCSTCHLQRLAFTDGRRTGIGVSGKPLAFNSMSLVNLMWGPPRFFWDGRAATLEEQALVPIQHADEMAQDVDRLVAELAADVTYRALFDTAYGGISASAIARALASFERTMISANSRYDQFLRGDDHARRAGGMGSQAVHGSPGRQGQPARRQLHRLPQPVPDQRVQHAPGRVFQQRPR